MLGITLFVAVVAILIAALTFGVIQSNTIVIVLAAIPLGLIALWFVVRGYHEVSFDIDAFFWALLVLGIAFGWALITFIPVVTRPDSPDSDKELFFSILIFLISCIALILGWVFVLLPLVSGGRSCFKDSLFVGYSLDSLYPKHRKAALSSIRDQSRLKAVAHDARAYEDIRILAATKLEDQKEAQSAYLELAIQRGSVAALEHLQNPDLIDQVAKSASSDEVRAAACLKTGGHFLDSECHCSVCGGVFHDWQTASTDEAEKNKSRANDPDDKLLFICTRCHALHFRGQKPIACERKSEVGVDYYDLGSWLCTKDSCEGCKGRSTESYDYFAN
jgi:hypothetical protein